MLITLSARVTRSHGPGQHALPAEGLIEYAPAAPGIWEGALRAQDPVTSRITDGEARPVNVAPGAWRVNVIPEFGPAWDPWLIELAEDGPTELDLADLTPVAVIDGEKWLRGDRGVSVTGYRDNGDGTLTWLFSDGTESEPTDISQGAQGVGIADISDPDEDSVVTVTYTDGSEQTVQAIQGHSPVITWDGTRPVVDGEPGPDLKGEPGDGGHSPVITWEGTTIVTDGEPGPDLKGATGEPGADGARTWEQLEDVPAEFPPETHTHKIRDVDQLEPILDWVTGDVADVKGRATALEEKAEAVETSVSALESTLEDVRAYAVEFPYSPDWYMGQSPTRIIVTPVEGGRFCQARARIQNLDARLDLPSQQWVTVPANAIPSELQAGDTDYIDIRLPQGDARGLIEMAYSINRVRIKALETSVAWTVNGSVWFDMAWFVPDN